MHDLLGKRDASKSPSSSSYYNKCPDLQKIKKLTKPGCASDTSEPPSLYKKIFSKFLKPTNLRIVISNQFQRFYQNTPKEIRSTLSHKVVRNLKLGNNSIITGFIVTFISSHILSIITIIVSHPLSMSYLISKIISCVNIYSNISTFISDI